MYHIFLSAFLLIYSSIIFPQTTIINRNFLLREQIHSIEIVAPISNEWLIMHPAFDTTLNAQWFEFKYNHIGLCTEMKWKFCRINNFKLDTSIQSLEHNYYFDYNDTLLTSIHINSFSNINNVTYQYAQNNLIIRTLFFHDKTQTDTLQFHIQTVSTNDPYTFPIFPKNKVVYLNYQYTLYALFNKVPLINLLTDNDYIIIYACPILIFIVQ